MPQPFRILLSIVGAFALAACFAAKASAQAYETPVRHAVLIDADTDSVLFAKSADTPMPPASMAKLMTMSVVFDALKTGRLRPDQEFVVSEYAWRTGGAPSGGSTMFAALGSSIRVDDLMHAIVIQSANDGAIAVAEGMAGSEAGFAALMNDEAKKIGLTNSHFTNPTGLPDPDQYVTALDLARLARHLIEDFPEYYPLYSQTEFTWNKIRQMNRNPLLDMNIGADGLKTGYTDASGYGLVGSAVQNGQRLIVVINGAATAKEREEEARKLLVWGFNSFHRVTLFDKDETIAEARVFGGIRDDLPLVTKEAIDVLVPSDDPGKLVGSVHYQGPVMAPVTAGQEIGTLRIESGGRLLREAPVYAAADIGVGGIADRAKDGLRELLFGWW